MVTSSITIMNGRTWSSTLVRPVNSNASTRSGIVPTQYLDHSSARRSSGLERSSHMCRPSSDTAGKMKRAAMAASTRSEEHTSELQSLTNLVCRLLLEKKKKNNKRQITKATTTY